MGSLFLTYQLMHLRNSYAERPPDFAQLARDVPELQQFLLPSSQHGFSIDFQNPDALRTLTSALLKRDFGLTLQLPADRLCPAIPGRLDYCLIVQDIVKADCATRKQLSLPGQPEIICGLDIGTGASAIYPLLFCRLDSNIRMIGTDIDATSLGFAKQNVQHNGLHDRISLISTDQNGDFFDKALQLRRELDFTMCNPPFYSSQAEIEQLAENKDFAPHAVCTGSENEMITQGGEVAFVSRMIEESAGHGQQIRWFTSLLGKASSVIQIVKHFAKYNCTNYAVIEMLQAHTQRWIVAWSWQAIRLPDSLARQIPPGHLTRSLPESNTRSYTFPTQASTNDTLGKVKAALDGIALEIRELDGEEAGSPRLLIVAASLSWTRAARRSQISHQPNAASPNSDPLMACTITLDLALGDQNDSASRTCTLNCEWKYGVERQTFHSCFSFLVRKLAAQLKDGKSRA